MKSVQALTQNLIDYAGLFPPAQLDMATSVRNYQEYRTGPDSGKLGRFIVPAGRLAELSVAVGRIERKPDQAIPLSISVLLGGEPEEEIKAILKFNCEHWVESELGHCLIDTVEFKAGSHAEIARVKNALPSFYRAFCEVNPREMEATLDWIAGAGFGAKIRTGGTEARAFPAGETVIAFLDACRSRGITFKATAGLHHVLWGDYPFTYDIYSLRGRMFGFLNVFAAAVFLSAGMDRERAVKILKESDRRNFRFDDERMQWRDHSVTVEEIISAREQFATSFGSCSFTEPVEELADLLAANSGEGL